MRRDRAGLFAFSIFRKAPHDRPRYADSSLKGKGVYLGRLYLPKNKSGADSGVGEELRGATGQGALISAFRNNFVRYMAFEPDPCAFSKSYPPQNYVIRALSDSLKPMTGWVLQRLSAVRMGLRQRRDLLLEFIALRHQLAVLRRTGTRRRFP